MCSSIKCIIQGENEILVPSNPASLLMTIKQ